MAEKAYITAKVFKWARESAKMTEEIAASKVAVSIDKFKDWENGEDFPTIRQAQTLAKANQIEESLTRINLFLITTILPVYNKEDIQTGKIIRLVYKLKTVNLKKLNEYKNRFPKTWGFKTSRLENSPLILRDAA